MLRRTADGYLEIIEIKTPFQEAIMLFDNSHNSFYPSSKVSASVGQIVNYISEIERNRSEIIAKDNEDPLKIRARLIIGRDGDKKHQDALRSHNSHHNSIEILTFDQLLRIGKRTLDVFVDEIRENSISQKDLKTSEQQLNQFEYEIPF